MTEQTDDPAEVSVLVHILAAFCATATAEEAKRHGVDPRAGLHDLRGRLIAHGAAYPDNHEGA